MRIPTQIPPTIFETFPRISKQISPRVSIPSSTATASQSQSRAIANNMSKPAQVYSPSSTSTSTSTSAPLTFSNYKIENTTFSSAQGISLSDPQKVITGSILDLFAGRPSLRKLSLWLDDATFADPLTIAEGRKQYAAQWYGLRAAFSDIQRLSCTVVSDGNPIELEMKNKYTVKGIGKEQTIDSKIKIFTEGAGDQMRVKKVEDRWGGQLPEGAFATAMRNLNSVVVPGVVSVPKSIEEEERSQ